MISLMQQSGAIIISTLRRTWRDINTPVLWSGHDFVHRHSAHAACDLIKGLLMATAFYRHNVYVDIRAPNECDIQRLAVSPPPIINQAFFFQTYNSKIPLLRVD